MNRKLIGDLGAIIQGRYGVDIKGNPNMLDPFVKLVNEIDKHVLENYFSGEWHSSSNFETRKSGRKMVDKILSMGDDITILDVGCGDNELKQYFGNRLLGIDPYNDKADLKVSIEDFAGKKFYDVVLVLGSLNFGDDQVITQQFIKAFNRLKPGGKMFLRANPGITHDNDKAKWIDFYEWSHEKVNYFAEQLNMEVNELSWDHDTTDEGRWGNRIYAELTRIPMLRS